MPEIEFTIDAETGNCETEIKGIQGKGCEEAAKQLRKLLGEPETDRKTAEYFAKIQNRPQVKGKR